jgi:hypothetical protein
MGAAVRVSGPLAGFRPSRLRNISSSWLANWGSDRPAPTVAAQASIENFPPCSAWNSACIGVSARSAHEPDVMEDVMNKQMIVLASLAVGAASTAFVSAAEARGGGRGGHFHFHASRVWTPTFEKPREEPYVVRRKVIEKTYVEKKTVTASVKTVDAKGRQYDPASKVWFDGKGQCWSGKEAFALKNGVWFYGDARWYEVNGAWKTNAAEAPATIDCEASPIFAAKLQGAPKTETRKTVGENTGEKARPVKKTTAASGPAIKVAGQTAEEPARSGEAPKATECKKYFPNVGEMLSVPCGK